MNVKQTARAVSLGVLLGLASLSGSAFADDQTERWWAPEVQKMAHKDGMVTKKDFMKMMEKKFDAMDKAKKGMLSQQDIMRIFNDKTGA